MIEGQKREREKKGGMGREEEKREHTYVQSGGGGGVEKKKTKQNTQTKSSYEHFQSCVGDRRMVILFLVHTLLPINGEH